VNLYRLRFTGRILLGMCRVVARRLARGPLRPSWSLRTELLHMAMRTAFDTWVEWGIPWARSFEGRRPPAARRVRFADVEANGVSAEWFVPEVQTGDRTILYFHGGGYVTGSTATHRGLIAALAVAAQARVLGVNYRLAPEHPFPAAQDDALTTYDWLISGHARVENTVLAGDSAGGALCIETMIGARRAGLASPLGAVLISPWTDPAATGGTLDTNLPFDIGGHEFVEMCVEATLAGHDPMDPRIAVLYADLQGLAPLYVQGGGVEVGLDQIVELAQRAEKAGVSVDLQIYEDMFHVFQNLVGRLPVAQHAIDDIAAWLAPRWKDA